MTEEEAYERRMDAEGSGALREHWRTGTWELAHHDSPCTWGEIWSAAWPLLVCTLLRHKWHDVDFVLSGEPGDYRRCLRCDRPEDLVADDALRPAGR